MEATLTLKANEFALPEDAKIAKVFERLVRVNAAVTENGMHEVYYEHHDRYEEAYSICFF